MDTRPVGIFDSGYGGLTVLQEVRKALPDESLLYFGDSANAPYSRYSEKECVERALACAEALRAKQAKALIVACNLMSGLALPSLRENVACPVIGVIDAGARETSRVCAKKGSLVGIIASPVLVASGTYTAAIQALRPDIAVRAIGTGKLVSLVEEGKMDTPEADAVVEAYMREFDGVLLDGLVLGCTHYPLLASSIRKVFGDKVPLIDPARNTADQIKQILENEGLCCPPGNIPAVNFYTSGDPEAFSRFIQSVLRIDEPNVAHMEAGVLGEIQ